MKIEYDYMLDALRCHREVMELAYDIFGNAPEIDGLDHGWTRLEEGYQISVGLIIEGIRVNVSRMFKPGEDPEKIAIKINAELLSKIDEIYEEMQDV